MNAALSQSASLAAMTWPSDFYATFGNNQPEMVRGQLISGNYFQTLETYPALGRLLTVDDDRCWVQSSRRDQLWLAGSAVSGGIAT